MRDGLAYFSTRALLEDSRGDLWIGTDRGLSHMHAGAFLSDAATQALAQMKVWAIHEDADWQPLVRHPQQRPFPLPTMASSPISPRRMAWPATPSIRFSKTAQGHLWMSGPNGISTAQPRMSSTPRPSPSRAIFALTFYLHGRHGGQHRDLRRYAVLGLHHCRGRRLVSEQSRTHSYSSLAATSLFRLRLCAFSPCSPTDVSLAIAQPVVLQAGNEPPGVRFHAHPAPFPGWSSLPLHARRLRKRLEPATTARTADYTNLPAGRYRFRVQAFEIGNPDAVTEASIPVVQQPFSTARGGFATCGRLLPLLIYGDLPDIGCGASVPALRGCSGGTKPAWPARCTTPSSRDARASPPCLKRSQWTQ